MSGKSKLTAVDVSSQLSYCQKSGQFTWLVSKTRTKSGDVAGSIDSKGYRCIRINGEKHKASRLAFLLMTRDWPEGQMDHINRVKDDDKWSNLREASASLNMLNRGVFRSNTSGNTGVVWNKRRKRWLAQIGSKGAQRCIGSFLCKDDAVVAYEAAYLKQIAVETNAAS